MGELHYTSEYVVSNPFFKKALYLALDLWIYDTLHKYRRPIKKGPSKGPIEVTIVAVIIEPSCDALEFLCGTHLRAHLRANYGVI